MQKKQKAQKNLPTYQPTNLLTLFLVSWFFSLSVSSLKANNLDLVIDIAKAKQIDYLAQRINAVYDYANVYVLQQGTVDTVSKSALKLNLDTGDEVYKAYETNTDFDISITANKQNIQFTNILPANSTQRTINILKRSPYLHPFAYVDGQTVVIPLKPSTLDLLNKLSSAKAKSNTVVSLTQPSDTSKVWYKPNGSGGYEVYSYVNNVWTPLSSSDQKVQTPVLTDASQLNSLTATKGDSVYLIQNEKAIKYIYDGTTWLKEGGSSGATNASGTCDATQIGSIRYSVDDDKMQHCASSGWVNFGEGNFGGTGGGSDEECTTIYNSCYAIKQANPSAVSSIYTIDPDGELGNQEPFQVYCDMTTDGGGWTKVEYSSNLEYKQHFSGGDAWRWMPNDFSLKLSSAQINSIRSISSKGNQQYVHTCNGVLAYYFASGNYYSHALGFKFLDGTTSNYGQQTYNMPITVIQDGCKTNDGEGGALNKATIFKIDSLSVPVVNMYGYDNGQGGEKFGSPLMDNPAWFGGGTPSSYSKCYDKNKPFASCKAILDAGHSKGNGVYTIDPDNEGNIEPFQVYCDMSTDGGGWTLLMKAKGDDDTFKYNASYWTQTNVLNANDLDLKNTNAKYDSFNHMKLKEIKADFFTIDHILKENITVASSALELFQITKDLGNPLTQYNDNFAKQGGFSQYGFNLKCTSHAKVRWGWMWNNETSCSSNDTSSGLGLSYDGNGRKTTMGTWVTCCSSKSNGNYPYAVRVWGR
jgi:hypothetical protein